MTVITYRTLGLVQLPSLQFRAPHVAAASGFVVPPPLFISFRHDGRNGQMAPRGIDGNECKVGGAHVLAMVQQVVLNVNLNSDLHRGVKNSIHRRAENDEIADVSWRPEIKMVDGRCYYVVSAVTMRSHRSREVDPVHKASTQESSERVGIVW